MKRMQCSLVAIVLTSANIALAAVPTKESIERLFVAAHVEQLVIAKQSQVASGVKRVLDQAFPATSLNPETKAFLEAHAAGFSAKLKREFNWENFKSEFTRIYQETYTQEDVDAQIAFYESAAGKVVAAKAPIIAMNTSQLMQDHVTPLAQQSTVEAIEAVKKLQQKKKK